MARADGRVRPGQNLTTAFSARAWNRAQDAADIVLGDRGGLAGNGPSYSRPNLVVTVRNQSGGLAPRFGVLSISDVMINPNTSDETEATFADRPVLVGVNPNVTLHGDKFVMCLEPIANNAYGRAIISGMFACKVRINQTSHNYATAKLNDRDQLQSSTCGPVLLLWKDVVGWSTSNRDDRWAVGVM
jgi:hypothetical protein